MKWIFRKLEDIFYSNIGIAILLIIVAIAFVLLVLALAGSPRQAIAGDITNFRTARRLAPATIHSDKVTTRESVPVVTILCEISAYSPTVAETDGNPLRTASGKRVYVGGIAADWDVLPCGSIVTIPNYNNGDPCTVIDQGGAIQGNKLDVFFWHEQEAVNWGRRRKVEVQVLYMPKEK